MEIIHRDSSGLRVAHVEFSKTPNQPSAPGHQYAALSGEEHDYMPLIFRNGPVPTNGVNGWTNEALLAALIHRTTVLDLQYPCIENAEAIAHMRAALTAFESRTAKRIARGVEGTMTA